MTTQTEPVGPDVDWFDGSSVAEIADSPTGLRVVVQAAGREGPYAEVHFPYSTAFQAMMEGDMVGLIDAPFTGRHVVYRVLAGGWKDAVAGVYLTVSGAINEHREWLIVSDIGRMVSVISYYTPSVRVYGGKI